jgi:hypothetical protein
LILATSQSGISDVCASSILNGEGAYSSALAAVYRSVRSGAPAVRDRNITKQNRSRCIGSSLAGANAEWRGSPRFCGVITVPHGVHCRRITALRPKHTCRGDVDGERGYACAADGLEYAPDTRWSDQLWSEVPVNRAGRNSGLLGDGLVRKRWRRAALAASRLLHRERPGGLPPPDVHGLTRARTLNSMSVHCQL